MEDFGMNKHTESSMTEKKPKNKLDIARLIIGIIQFIAVACAVITLIIELYPQIKPNNSNLLEMANAGDYQSQIELAHFYYETGDFSEAVYWYKVALISNDDTDVLALNNLGYLYSRGYGLASEAVSEKERLEIALSLFDKAIHAKDSDENLSTAAMNKYLLLITFGEDMFDDYEMELKNTNEFLRQQKDFDELVIVPERRIKSQKTFDSSIVIPTGWINENTYVALSGAHATQFENGYSGIQYIYIQTVYEEGQEKLPELQYISPLLQNQ